FITGADEALRRVSPPPETTVPENNSSPARTSKSAPQSRREPETTPALEPVQPLPTGPGLEAGSRTDDELRSDTAAHPAPEDGVHRDRLEQASSETVLLRHVVDAFFVVGLAYQPSGNSISKGATRRPLASSRKM